MKDLRCTEGRLLGMIMGAMSTDATVEEPPLYGRVFRRLEEQITNSEEPKKHLQEMEFLLESIHPRHYERMHKEYETLKEKISKPTNS